MRERILDGAVCAIAVLLAGCGAQPSVAEQTSAIVSSDDITGIPGCPGSWQLAESYEGFAGQYLRANPIGLTKGDLMTLGIFSAVPEPNSIRFTGTYLASLFGSAVQGGTYEALDANPLIGSLLILGPVAAGSPQAVYAVIGLRRNGLRNISAVCLAGMEHDGLPFEIDRVGL